MLVAFDLDDTLYQERDFQLSAYRRIAHIIGRRHKEANADSLYRAMRKSKNGFRVLNLRIPSEWPESDISWMVQTYRTHLPDIKLSTPVCRTLDELVARGHTLALITDGRSVTQRHKIESLGLTRWIDPGLISISEEIGADKHERQPFERMETLTPDETERIYVADNYAKDFRWPRAMGWKTVCLRDRGRNIFAQCPDEHSPEYHPHHTIDRLSELLDLL